MRWSLHVPALLLIAATAIPVMRGSDWWIRIFDFPRLQVAVLSGIVLVLYCLLRRAWDGTDFIIAGALVMAFATQVYQIAPYTVVGPKQVQRCAADSEPIRLLNANVLMDNRNVDAYLGLVARLDPDVALFLETDDWWDAALEGLSESHPYSVRVPLDNTYGMVLYSKLEFVDQEVRFIVDDDVPSIFVTLRLQSGRTVRLVCLHPRPPRPDKLQDSTERDLELVLAAGHINEVDGPVVAMGDLNDVAWPLTTRRFQEISELKDPRRGRGLYSTFHAGNPLLRWPLDHIFLSDEFGTALIERQPSCDSDHFPIVYDLCFRGEGPQTD